MKLNYKINIIYFTIKMTTKELVLVPRFLRKAFNLFLVDLWVDLHACIKLIKSNINIISLNEDFMIVKLILGNVEVIFFNVYVRIIHFILMI